MINSPTASQKRERFIYSISQLNTEVKELLEGSFPLIWVEGELSNFSRPASGHWYFTLKDSQAQVRCAMFRMRNTHVSVTPKEGMQVLIRARVSLYGPRGDYQVIAEHMEEAGDGALRRAFEQLKAKLAAEGLFDAARKKAIPKHPQQLGVITSPSGAAIRDILTVLRRRHPGLPVMIYPVAVQGKAATREIVEAIELANQRAECDVLIVGRGGGSLEDLWCFNEETVARAIAHSRIPIISAVGHEVDYTISDFVADLRAPTPSAAAELVSPDMTEQLRQLQVWEQRLIRRQINLLESHQKLLNWLTRRLQSPEQRLATMAQRLDELAWRLQQTAQQQQRHLQQQLAILQGKLHHLSPEQRLDRLGMTLERLTQQLTTTMHYQLKGRRQQLAAVSHNLDAVSPLATLSRGYAIVSKLESGELIRSSQQLQTGDTLQTRLGSGQVVSRVEKCLHD